MKSIKSKLTLLILIILIICLLTAGAFYYNYAKNTVKKISSDHIVHISKDVLSSINDFFNERLFYVKSAATSIYIRERLKKINTAHVHDDKFIKQICYRLDQLKINDIHISEFFILNLKGKIVASTIKENIGKDKSNCKYFKIKEEIICKVFLDSMSDDFEIIVSVPLIDEYTKEFLGQICANLTAKNIVKRMRKSEYLCKGESWYIIDENGFFVFGTIDINEKLKPKRMFSKQRIDYFLHKTSGPIVCKNPADIDVIIFCNRLEYGNWVFVIEKSIQESFAPIYKLRDFFILIGIIIIVIAAFIIFNITNYFTRPIYKLTHASKKIANGDLSVSINIKTNDEMEILANSFNQMTHSLKESKKELDEWTQTLEHKIDERTKELKKANDKLSEKNVELKRFNKMAVARELKMIELKNEIERLKTN